MRATIKLALMISLLTLTGVSWLPATASGARSLEETLNTDQAAALVRNTVTHTVLRPVESPRPMPLPKDPRPALMRAIERQARELGVSTTAVSTQPAGDIPRAVAGRLAQVLDAMSGCSGLSQDLVAGLPEREMASFLSGSRQPTDLFREQLSGCARSLLEATSRLVSTLEGGKSKAQQVIFDVWPVVRFDTSVSGTTYEHDYALIVDTEGDDFYDNNAGGNLLDVRRGPAGTPPPPEVGPAVGCQRVLDLATAECVVGAAVLIDTSGSDTYGERKAPRPAPYDARCTGDTVVPRIVTQGAGLAGVGVLMDTAGSDSYVGRTISQGAGHVAGVGVLIDHGSASDSYLAARNSQGFALVGGVGVLADDSDNLGGDTFDHYMPEGGLVDDADDCDDVPRFVQGAGNLGGIGILTSLSSPGSHYRGPAQAHGYGALGGVGALIDIIGGDSYEGGPGRDGCCFDQDLAVTPDAGVGVWVNFPGL